MVRGPPVCFDDFKKALEKIKSSVCIDDLKKYEVFTTQFGWNWWFIHVVNWFIKSINLHNSK